MHDTRLTSVAALLAVLAVTGTGPSAQEPTPASQPRSTTTRKLDPQPLSFEENRGQADTRVRYMSRARDYAIALTDDEALLLLRKPASAGDDRRAPSRAGCPPAHASGGCGAHATHHRARSPSGQGLLRGRQRERTVEASRHLRASRVLGRLPRNRSCLLRRRPPAGVRLHRRALRRSRSHCVCRSRAPTASPSLNPAT